MKPNEPHSFTPRNPATAEGRVTCGVCALGAHAEPHLLGMLQRMATQAATPPVLCSVCGLRKCYRKGKCRACYRRETIVAAVVTPDIAERMDAARGPSISRSAWIRGAILRALTVEVPLEKDDPTAPDPEHFP